MGWILFFKDTSEFSIKVIFTQMLASLPLVKYNVMRIRLENKNE